MIVEDINIAKTPIIRSILNSNFLSRKILTKEFILFVYLNTFNNLKIRKILKTLRGLYVGSIANKSIIDIGENINSSFGFITIPKIFDSLALHLTLSFVRDI